MASMLFFDIDGTLFDSGSEYRLFLIQLFSKIFKTSENEIKSSLENYVSKLTSSTDFNPDELIEKLGVLYQKDISRLKNKFWECQGDYQQFLFPEVRDVLTSLSSQNLEMGIFSEGFEKFQNHKLSCSGIIKFFLLKNIFVFRRKTTASSLSLLPPGLSIIDNKLEVLADIKGDFKLIWLDRKNQMSEVGDLKIKRIENLRELLNII